MSACRKAIGVPLSRSLTVADASNLIGMTFAGGKQGQLRRTVRSVSGLYIGYIDQDGFLRSCEIWTFDRWAKELVENKEEKKEEVPIFKEGDTVFIEGKATTLKHPLGVGGWRVDPPIDNVKFWNEWEMKKQAENIEKMPTTKDEIIVRVDIKFDSMTALLSEWDDFIGSWSTLQNANIISISGIDQPLKIELPID
jgi:hypothetical protein